MDGSWGLSKHNCQKHRVVPMKKYGLLIWHSACICDSQWEVVWLWFLLEVLRWAAHKELILISRTSSGKWTSISYQQDHFQNFEKEIERQERWLGRRSPRSPLGVSDYQKNSHKGNPVCSSFRDRSSHPSRVGVGKPKGWNFQSRNQRWRTQTSFGHASGKAWSSSDHHVSLPGKGRKVFQQEGEALELQGWRPGLAESYPRHQRLCRGEVSPELGRSLQSD